MGADSVQAVATIDEIRVLVVDDQDLYRRGLQLVLSQEPDINVVGQARDGAQAVDAAIELTPDVVLMDIQMPRRSGIEAAAAIRAQVPSARIVMLTSSEEESDLFEAIRAGAHGYLLKTLPEDELAEGLRSVYAGHSPISPSMASKLLLEFSAISVQAPRLPTVDVPRLTVREVEVLKLLARGSSNRDIARELFISENTVKNHVRNILDKLQLHSRMQAAMYAVRNNLVDPAG